MDQRRPRKGFTLAEMLVTVSVIAVLAAVVVPSISGSLFKGDAGRVTNDLLNVRGGIEQFLADVRKYPGKAADLSTLITTGGSDLNLGGSAATYTQAVVNRWRGPYLNSVVGQTGFGGTIGNDLQKVDCTANTAGTPTPSVTANACLAIVVTGISPAEARRVDYAMDDSVSTTGLIRFKASGVDSLWFLGMPMQ
jgi:prepilin-type N-terminal cleavage/methylation domain-containing protein